MSVNEIPPEETQTVLTCSTEKTVIRRREVKSRRKRVFKTIRYHPPAVNLGRTFTCKMCGAYFTTKQKLGGHVGNKQPGMSDNYNHKIKVREEREVERAIY